MRRWLVWGLLGGGLSLLAATAWAQADEEAQLQAAAEAIDQTAKAGTTDQGRVDALAKRFGVLTSTVEDLRENGRGWGEITVALAMADRLAKSEAHTYPTVADALQQIETRRGEGKGWGAISRELGVTLGPVVSEVQRARPALSERERPPVERPTRPEHERHERIPQAQRFNG